MLGVYLIAFYLYVGIKSLVWQRHSFVYYNILSLSQLLFCRSTVRIYSTVLVAPQHRVAHKTPCT